MCFVLMFSDEFLELTSQIKEVILTSIRNLVQTDERFHQYNECCEKVNASATITNVVRGSGQYGKILTAKEPIRIAHFTRIGPLTSQPVNKRVY